MSDEPNECQASLLFTSDHNPSPSGDRIRELEAENAELRNCWDAALADLAEARNQVEKLQAELAASNTVLEYNKIRSKPCTPKIHVETKSFRDGSTLSYFADETGVAVHLSPCSDMPQETKK